MYKAIEPKSAHNFIQEHTVTIVDIRDPDSFDADHLNDAQHVTNENIEEFIDKSDLDQPLLVYCYHGNSSQSAADYFVEQGFEDVYHLVGGIEAWRSSGLPIYST